MVLPPADLFRLFGKKKPRPNSSLTFSHTIESSMTPFTVTNRDTAFLLFGPIGGGNQCLSVTGEGVWLEKKLGEKGRRLKRARADGRAMRWSSIVPADVAEIFHGFSRGDAIRNQHWREIN